MEEEKFTIEEIRNYLRNQDSFGDALHFLTVENIKKANEINEQGNCEYWASEECDCPEGTCNYGK